LFSFHFLVLGLSAKSENKIDESGAASADHRATENLKREGEDIAPRRCSDKGISANSSFREVLLGKDSWDTEQTKEGDTFPQPFLTVEGEKDAQAQIGKRRT